MTAINFESHKFYIVIYSSSPRGPIRLYLLHLISISFSFGYSLILLLFQTIFKESFKKIRYFKNCFKALCQLVKLYVFDHNVFFLFFGTDLTKKSYFWRFFLRNEKLLCSFDSIHKYFFGNIFDTMLIFF